MASSIKKAVISGGLFGLSQFILLIFLGFTFFLGIILVETYQVKLQNVITAIYTIFFSGVCIGNISYYIPDLAGSRTAAASLFDIHDSLD